MFIRLAAFSLAVSMLSLVLVVIIMWTSTQCASGIADIGYIFYWVGLVSGLLAGLEESMLSKGDPSCYHGRNQELRDYHGPLHFESIDASPKVKAPVDFRNQKESRWPPLLGWPRRFLFGCRYGNIELLVKVIFLSQIVISKVVRNIQIIVY